MINEAKLIDHFILKKMNANLINFSDTQFDEEFKKNLDVFYDVNENSVLSIFNSLKKNKDTLQRGKIKLFKKIWKNINLEKKDFVNFIFIKSVEDYVLCICAILILQSFSRPIHQQKYDLKHEKYDLKKYKNAYSYAIINHVNYNLIKFVDWNCLHDFITDQRDDYKDLIKLFLCILTKDKLLSITILTDSKQKTQIFYWPTKNLEIKSYFNNFSSSQIFYMPLKYIKKNEIFYTYTNHFSSMNSIFLKNPFSGASFILEDLRLLDYLCNSFFYVDPTQIEYVLDIKLKFYKINKNNLFDLYDSSKNALLAALHANDTLKMTEHSQKMSFYESLIKLHTLSKNISSNVKLYGLFFFDFRGRLYYLSDTSITFNSDLRYCIFTFDNEVIDFNNKYKLKIKQTLKEHFHFINNLKKFTFDNATDSKKESIIWVLIYIAEFDKTKLGKEVSIEKFLLHAIKVINDFNNNDEELANNLERYLHIAYGLKILNEIHDNSPKIWFLKKDCTASVYQILIKVLGHNDDIYLKHCNLNSEDTWYDTYSFIIENFLKHTKLNSFIIKNKLENTITRDYYKKSIMTETYNACWGTFKKYFLDKFDPCSLTYNLLIQKEHLSFLKEFYNFLKKNNIYFKTNPKEIEKFIIERDGFIIFLDKSQVNLAYKKIKTFQVEFLFDEIRITQKRKFPTSELDLKKTKNSAKANYTHAQDAVLMRQVLMWGYHNNLYIFGIHDCWMLGYNNVTNLVAVVNESANMPFHLINSNEKQHEFYSFFIVI